MRSDRTRVFEAASLKLTLEKLVSCEQHFYYLRKFCKRSASLKNLINLLKLIDVPTFIAIVLSCITVKNKKL